MSTRIAIGFGASSRATRQDLLALIEQTFAERTRETLLATIDRRAALAHSVAQVLGLQLVLLPSNRLAKVDGVESMSEIAEDAVGTASVAEAAALAALGEHARLLIPRRTGRLCTCAVAVLS